VLFSAEVLIRLDLRGIRHKEADVLPLNYSRSSLDRPLRLIRAF
jgi:hypothetical protein